MIEANKYKLGVFVFSGVVLGITLLFVFGSWYDELFEKQIEFISVFDESVQGLDEGAPVKYRGVTIGKVQRITIRARTGMKDNLVMVEMQALPSAIDPVALKYSDSTTAKAEFFHQFFANEVKQGLRCRLDMVGITGGKYVEIDYFSPVGKPISFSPPAGTLYLPSAPSLFSEITKSIAEACNNIAKVNFDEISHEMETSLQLLNKYLSDPKINDVIDKLSNISDHLQATAKNLNETLTREAIENIISEVKQSLNSIEKLSEKIQKHVEAAKIGETSADIRQALTSVNEIKKRLSKSLNTIDHTIDRANETMSVTEEFINYLDDDPSSIIRGKHQPPFFKKK